MIQFRGSYTREVLLRALRLTNGKFRPILWLFGAGMVFSIFGVIVVPLQLGAPPETVLGNLWPLLFFTVMFVLLLWIPRAGVNNLLKTNKLIQEPIEGHADETGVYFSTTHSRSDLTWDLFYQTIVTDDMVLLGQSSAQFYAFPREFFSSDPDWTAFQALAREKTSKAPGQGKTLLQRLLLWMVIFVVIILVWNLFLQGR